MLTNNCHINIMVKGRKVTEFTSPMDMQSYIEGRDGSEFEIEFVNEGHADVEAIISVDGLSITDGKPAGSTSSGYIVPARRRISIPGWTLDKATTAKFFFAGAKGGSYAEQSGQDDRNKGVIGAKVFARKATYNYNNAHVTLSASGFGNPPGVGGGFVVGSNAAYGSPAYGSMMKGMSSNNAMSCSASAASAAPMSYTSDSFTAKPETTIAPVEQTLGTGFGAATDFATTTVAFERGDMLALMELFYDDAQGLKRRGIDVRRPMARPSAFPADEPKGCVPPLGWADKR